MIILLHKRKLRDLAPQTANFAVGHIQYMIAWKNLMRFAATSFPEKLSFEPPIEMPTSASSYKKPPR
jgi:hypothetical protein